MNCPKCNQEIKEGSKFCEFCGTPVGGENINMAQPQAGQMPTPKKPIDKKRMTRIGVIAAIAIVALIVVIVLVKTHKTKLDLQDYTKVEFSGYEKYGTASIKFDSEKLAKDFADAAGIKKDLEELDADALSEISNYSDMIELFNKMEYKLNKESGLKNGDTVKVTYKFDNDLAKKYKVQFVGETMEVKVSGLKKVKEVDPFKDLKVEFSGTSPDASVTVTNESKEEALSSLYFQTEPSGDLAIGDKVKVFVDYNEDSFIEQYGCILTQTEKEYTVENVDAYVTASGDLDEEVLNQMKKQTEDTIKSYFAAEKDELKQSDLKYAGYYFLSKKNPDSWNANNIVYIVYSAKVKSKAKSFKTSTVYFPVKFSNVIKYADGTIYVDLNSTTIEGHTGLSYGWWEDVNGYLKESDMKNELVTSQKADYSDEAVDGLK